MSLYEIQNDVPPPPAGTNRIYEFAAMKVGDSFLAPTSEAQRVRWAVKKYRRNNAPTTLWRTRTTSKGVRVWRVA